MGRRGATRWVLFLLFVVVPLTEIYVLVQVGQVIGPWWTILLLVVDSLVGAWLVRREGRRAWTALRAALSSGRMPATELADGALILVGGTLLLTPGFATDVVGMLLVVPLTRPPFRRLLARLVANRLVVAPLGRVQGSAGPPWERRRPGPGSGGSVVQGEVVDEP